MATYYVATYGSNSNNGTSPATPWLTLGFALGAASGTNPGLTAGDTLWIAPGTYRGVFTYGGGSGTAGNTVKIYGDPAFTRAWTSGAAGYVRLTNFTVDTTVPTASQTLSITADYIDLQDIYFDGQATSFSVTTGGVLFLKGGNLSVNRCVLTSNVNTTAQGLMWSCPAGKSTLTVTKCSLFSYYCIFPYLEAQGTTPYSINASITDCVMLTPNVGLYALNATAGQGTGLSVYNSTIVAANIGINIENYNVASASSNILRNNLIIGSSNGIRNPSTSITITQSNNIVLSSATFLNVLPTTNNISANAMLDFGASRIQGYGAFPWFAPITNALGIGAGTTTGAPLIDLYNNTWIGNPTVGSIESKSESDNGQYLPSERNASTITIAPGSTSQSIELYLGATGLTASTSGLSARYNRTRTASVSIPLVARTIAQAWTSGGFAEVDATNMPGVYRLDVPDAALAAGADDVTIVVRGASGTNGAVMTVKLSSGGLTAAQTAAAVWDEPYTSHTTASTFGARTLLTTADNRPAAVGTSNHIQSNVHAIVDSTAAASELSGALLHNGTDYISAELVTPVTQSALVRMGPYEVRADGLGASDPLDIQKSAQHGVDIQCVDAFGSGIDITSATVTAKVYNSGATLVDTYSCTATYAADGRAQFTIDTTVTNTPGTYTATITRTTGASDTQVFGPLRIYVRDI